MSVPRNIGAWCNGNTWVSKTFVVSSNLTAPAVMVFVQSVVGGLHFFVQFIQLRFAFLPGRPRSCGRR